MKKLTESVIGCAYTVYNTLGFGFLETVYEKSLQVELLLQGIKAKAQQPIKVRYREAVVGEYFADLLIQYSLIIELKSVSQLNQAHEVQLVNYLNATGIDHGLLVNFGAQQVKSNASIESIANAHPVDPVNPVCFSVTSLLR